MKRSCPSTSDSSSSSSKPRIEYDVFLSFRGEDTRNTFTSHLYKAFCDIGIVIFKDNKLPRGQSISPELLKAIESSRCSVIVLSENYASSSWCLDELVRILECMKDHKQIVLPIFYHVDPSDVRKQKGSIGEAFKRHESRYSTEKAQSWKDALTEVANLSGDPLHDGDEAQFIQKFIREVSRQLDVAQLKNSEEDFDISEDLFGMDSRLKKLNNFVCTSSSNDVRFIGICEMGGVGKTTLARTYREWKSSKFDSSSFLTNIREACEREKLSGLVSLQKHLLSDTLNGFSQEIWDAEEGKKIISKRLCHKKVLIILDDVSELDQLEALAGKDNWFGPGSRILITTRDESLLSTYKECEIYRPGHLNDNEGLQLFSWKAFESLHPPENYIELAKQVMEYAKGLPLALKVLGSSLRGKEIDEWKSALDRLKEHPEEGIVKVLQISFDRLKKTDQEIFLDIACFFNGDDKDEIIHKMDTCGFYARVGIRTLIDKSLLYDDYDNTLRMHDLLQEMGKEIVRGKYHQQPGKWSRLWNKEDIMRVLNNNTGTEEVKAIVCYMVESLGKFHFEALSNMKELRLLWFHNWADPLTNCDFTPPANLSNELRILWWYKFPFTSFPSSFQPNQLVELILRSSKIEQLWNNTTKPLYNLKVIDLSNSENIRMLEDFKVVPNLEELTLDGCSGLVEIHPSIKLLTRLTSLNLSDCDRLESLTSISGSKSLESLYLSGFENRHTLYPGNDLLIDPESGEATLKTIVGGGFYSLKILDLSFRGLWDGAFPEDFGCLASLEELNLMANKFSSLPSSLNQLSKLRILDLSFCENLKSVGPELPPSLEMVMVDGCTSLETFLDPSNDQCNLNCSATCRECFKMVNRQGSERTAFALLRRYLQNPPNSSRGLDILLPGDEIPAWFNNRSSWPTSTSISIQLDPNWCNSKWRGFALLLRFPKNWIDYYCCDVKINGQDWGHGPVKSPFCGTIEASHLWLFYLPSDMCFRTEWQNNKCSRIEFSFKTYDTYCKRYPTKLFGTCGARLVYEQDIEDLNLHYEDEDEYEVIEDLNLHYEDEDEDEYEDEDEDEDEDEVEHEDENEDSFAGGAERRNF